LSLGKTAEVTSGRGLLLEEVVLVESERQLLLWGAHGVGAIDAGCGVGDDAGAGGCILAADIGEVLAEGRGVNISLGRAGKGGHHAAAELGIGNRRKVAVGGPIGVNGWAGSRGGVGNDVGGGCSGAWRDLGDLAGENAEVWELAGGGARDAYET